MRRIDAGYSGEESGCEHHGHHGHHRDHHGHGHHHGSGHRHHEGPGHHHHHHRDDRHHHNDPHHHGESDVGGNYPQTPERPFYPATTPFYDPPFNPENDDGILQNPTFDINTNTQYKNFDKSNYQNRY